MQNWKMILFFACLLAALYLHKHYYPALSHPSVSDDQVMAGSVEKRDSIKPNQLKRRLWKGQLQ